MHESTFENNKTPDSFFKNKAFSTLLLQTHPLDSCHAPDHETFFELFRSALKLKSRLLKISDEDKSKAPRPSFRNPTPLYKLAMMLCCSRL
jgi:hypothetical protein